MEVGTLDKVFGGFRNGIRSGADAVAVRFLGKGECVTLSAGVSRVSCERGVLWLTLAGDPRDYILKPGDSLSLPPGKAGRAVAVTAMGNSTLRLAATN